jgi:ribosomal protein L11 methyltransferase
VPWLQLRFTVERDQAEALSAALEELGARAVTLQGASPDNLFDQIDEQPTLWASTNITALFDAEEDADQIIRALRTQLAPAALPAHEVSLLADQDWNRVWMDRFQPMRFGSRLWVVPSWHSPPQPEAVNLTLDPGMAFGTGTHPTTSMCLCWMDGTPLRSRSVLDYGCGSGILAIAAARLGAHHVEAVDIDPQCLEVTRANAERNTALGQIHISLPSTMQRKSFDVLVANILAGPLHELAADFAGYVKPGGDLVLSGLLVPQVAACLERYSQHFVIDDPTIDGDWAMLHGTRRS